MGGITVKNDGIHITNIEDSEISNIGHDNSDYNKLFLYILVATLFSFILGFIFAYKIMVGG